MEARLLLHLTVEARLLLHLTVEARLLLHLTVEARLLLHLTVEAHLRLLHLTVEARLRLLHLTVEARLLLHLTVEARLLLHLTVEARLLLHLTVEAHFRLLHLTVEARLRLLHLTVEAHTGVSRKRPTQTADGQDGGVRTVRLQSVAGHAQAILHQGYDGWTLGWGRGDLLRGSEQVGLGQDQGHGPMRSPRRLGDQVILDQLLHFLLSGEAVAGRCADGHVQTQPDRIAVAEELADRLFSTEGDMLALVVLQEQVELVALVIEVEVQIGLGQRGGQRLTRLQLQDLLGQVLGGACIGGRQAQAGQPAADRLAVQHGQEGRLADAAMAKDSNPLSPAQAVGQDDGLVLALRHGPVPWSVNPPSVW